MKKLILLGLFTIFLLKSYAQWGYGFVNFDDTAGLFRIYIDTTIPNNIWQIGAPHKHFFTSSYSIPNVIVTDTLNSYPVNNNSVFYYRTSGDYNTDYHGTGLEFWYKMDSDTLMDFGKIEISIDTGQTWNNILTGPGYSWMLYDSLGNFIRGSSSNDTIVFTGISNGWYIFSCEEPLSDGIIYDSIIFRFSFHSSGASILRDGWMIDDLNFHTDWESIPEKEVSCHLFPNPVKDRLTLTSKTLISEYEISNPLGYTVKKSENFQLPLHTNVSDLAPGIYFYKIKFVTGQKSFGKFIKL